MRLISLRIIHFGGLGLSKTETSLEAKCKSTKKESLPSSTFLHEDREITNKEVFQSRQ